jgi:hypothetical protein
LDALRSRWTSSDRSAASAARHGSIDVATEVQAALFMAHHLAAHDLVAPNELEAFLQALAAQLRALDDVERTPVGP